MTDVAQKNDRARHDMVAPPRLSKSCGSLAEVIFGGENAAIGFAQKFCRCRALQSCEELEEVPMGDL